MLISASPDAFASAVPPAGNSSSAAAEGPDNIATHTLRGSLRAVQATIHTLFRLNYAEPNDWSKPVPTGRHNEVMVVLQRRVRRNLSST